MGCKNTTDGHGGLFVENEQKRQPLLDLIPFRYLQLRAVFRRQSALLRPPGLVVKAFLEGVGSLRQLTVLLHELKHLVESTRETKAKIPSVSMLDGNCFSRGHIQ